MAVTTRDRLVEAYLSDLQAAARDLPSGDRDELVGSIEDHISQALPADASEADVRTTLERLGDPRQIVDDARGPEAPDAPARGWNEWGAVCLLPAGGLVVPVLGWIAGVALLWRSKLWTTRDKILGTLIVPGGLALPVVLGVATASTRTCTSRGVGSAVISHCTGGHSTSAGVLTGLLIAALAVASLAMAVYLAWRAGARSRR